ncbi:hypothetical protein SAMN05421548_11124 [Paraburkholderia lycopersici]|uniref:PXPV repeat-containing protein n=2 Tax=Paraburkholderia lycopersici TaxID=416944 RepID=A0A1G6Q0Z0_9BURK|nr:hypothetical protein SAMN05421548_11124 [Paraburkholderia lycopersici]
MKSCALKFVFLSTLAALCVMQTAQARVAVNVGVGIGIPGAFYAPPPPVVFMHPAPIWPPPLVYTHHGFSPWHHPPRFVGPRHARRPGWGPPPPRWR